MQQTANINSSMREKLKLPLAHKMAKLKTTSSHRKATSSQRHLDQMELLPSCSSVIPNLWKWKVGRIIPLFKPAKPSNE